MLCRDDYETVLFKVASLLTFFGALRISEVVATGKGDTSKLVLQWQNVRLVAGSIQIHIRRSKADQRCKGVYLTVGCCHVEDVCPVKAITSYLRIGEPGRNISLFIMIVPH